MRKWMIWIDNNIFFGAFKDEDAGWDALALAGIHHDRVSDNCWVSEMDAAFDLSLPCVRS